MVNQPLVKFLYNIFKSKKFDVRLIGNIGKPPLKEKRIEKNTIFIIEHHLTKYFIINILNRLRSYFKSKYRSFRKAQKY